ncbi:hypothetical protein P7K49_012893, partial [Saguinus oedipus]
PTRKRWVHVAHSPGIRSDEHSGGDEDDAHSNKCWVPSGVKYTHEDDNRGIAVVYSRT